MNETPEYDPIMQFFRYGHLPESLRAVARPFTELAHNIAASFPRNPERTVALRKLLEAKDAAVRSVLFAEPREDSLQTVGAEETAR